MISPVLPYFALKALIVLSNRWITLDRVYLWGLRFSDIIPTPQIPFPGASGDALRPVAVGNLGRAKMVIVSGNTGYLCRLCHIVLIRVLLTTIF